MIALHGDSDEGQGIVPTNSGFSWTHKMDKVFDGWVWICCKLSVGIVPVKSFPKRCRYDKFRNNPNVVGNVPVIRL